MSATLSYDKPVTSTGCAPEIAAVPVGAVGLCKLPTTWRGVCHGDITDVGLVYYRLSPYLGTGVDFSFYVMRGSNLGDQLFVEHMLVLNWLCEL